MRITNGMMVSTLRSNLNRNMNQMDKMQNQLSSGKKISKPSDDPVGVSFSLRLRNNLVENEQYSKNASEALELLDATDSALDESGKVLQRIRELTIKAANGTNDSSALKAMQDEVKELRGHLLSVTNTEFAGKFIFSGTATNVKTFSDIPESWQGNSTDINYEIGVAIKVPINVTAENVFKDPGNLGAIPISRTVRGADSDVSLFHTLDDLEFHMGNGNYSAIGDKIAGIDKWLDSTNTARSEVGARVNRLEFTKARLEGNNTNFTALLSQTEDADMAQLISDFKVQENVYRASLAAGARVIQPTLIDFMR